MIALFYLTLFLAAFYEYVHMPRIDNTWTLIKFVGMATCLAAAVKSLSTPYPVLLFKWLEAKLFFLFTLILAAFSIVGWVKYGGLPSMFWSYVSHVGMFFATLVFVENQKTLRRSIYAILASMLVAALYVFRDYSVWGMRRPDGIMGDPNYYALVVVAILPLSFLLPAPTIAGRLFIKGTAALLVASLLLSASRGGLLALGVCFAYLLMRTQRRFLYLGTLSVLLTLLIFVLPHSGLDRFQEAGTAETKSMEARIELMYAGFNMIKANPIFGVGPGRFKPMSPVYNPGVLKDQIAHNTFLELGAELGLPMLFIYCLIMFLMWRRMRRLGKHLRALGDDFGHRVAHSIEIGIVAFSVASIFLSAAYIRHIWIIIFLGLALQRLVALGIWDPIRKKVPAPQPAAVPVPAIRKPRPLAHPLSRRRV